MRYKSMRGMNPTYICLPSAVRTHVLSDKAEGMRLHRGRQRGLTAIRDKLDSKLNLRVGEILLQKMDLVLQVSRRKRSPSPLSAASTSPLNTKWM